MTEASSDLHPLDAQDSLVVLMIAISASDEQVQTAELIEITNMINNLPIFAGYDTDKIPTLSNLVFELFTQEDGLDTLFGLVRGALPDRLFETAYALCCDVAAADGDIRQSELRMLEEIRYELSLDRLHAAAIERGSRARHMTL